MRKKLGTFNINYTPVDLYVEDRGGADFRMEYESGKRSRMTIGLDSPDVAAVYERLLHETIELALALRGGIQRSPVGEAAYTAYYQFVFSHEVWQRAVADASRFLLETQRLVYDEYRKLKPDAPLGV